MGKKTEQARSEILGLDIIRFGAACAVTIYHLGYHLWSKAVTEPEVALWNDLRPLHAVARWGWVGVEIFFVLSGFLIAYTTTNKTPSSFVRGRILRLYPSAWICATVTFLVSYGLAYTALPLYLNSLILWPAGPWVSGVYWTLGIEIVFYGLIAFAMWRRISVVHVGCGLILWSAAYYVARVIDTLVGSPWAATFRLLDNQVGNLTLLRLGCYFGVGVLLWSIKFSGMTKSKIVWLATAIACCALELLTAGRFFVETRGGNPVESAIPLLLWLAGLGLIILSLRFVNTVTDGIQGKRQKLITTAGKMTYPLYLVHGEVGRDIMTFTHPYVGSTISMVLAFLIMLVVAYLIVRYEGLIGKPLARLLKGQKHHQVQSVN